MSKGIPSDSLNLRFFMAIGFATVAKTAIMISLNYNSNSLKASSKTSLKKEVKIKRKRSSLRVPSKLQSVDFPDCHLDSHSSIFQSLERKPNFSYSINHLEDSNEKRFSPVIEAYTSSWHSHNSRYLVLSLLLLYSQINNFANYRISSHSTQVKRHL